MEINIAGEVFATIVWIVAMIVGPILIFLGVTGAGVALLGERVVGSGGFWLALLGYVLAFLWWAFALFQAIMHGIAGVQMIFGLGPYA